MVSSTYFEEALKLKEAVPSIEHIILMNESASHKDYKSLYNIDDMPNNCNQVSEIPNISVFIIDNGNNIGENKKVVRVKSFEEISKVILNV